MTWTLHRKLAAVLLACAVVVMALFMLVMRHLDTARAQELNQKLYRSLAAELVREQIVAGERGLETEGARSVFDRLRKVNPRVDVYLLDAAGRIVAASSGTAAVRDAVDLAPLKRFLEDAAPLPILGDDPSSPSKQRVFSVAPVELEGHRDGYLYIVLRGLSSDTINQRIRASYVLRESLWTAGLGLLFVLLTSTLIVRLLTRPLQRLHDVTEKLKHGGFGTGAEGVASGRADEITEITDLLSRMADRILLQMGALQETDAQRRELIANISHDLRTPLASLQGYLETLQYKDEALSENERRAYLQIALTHTAQLSRLVGDLFELATLDSDQAALHAEPFALDELIADTVQQFQLQARERRVTLEVDAPEEMPLVHGDIGLIERVLRNVIENALRYTDPGGRITVSLRALPDAAAVAVTDTGCGIAPEDLPHVFEGFYRAEKSRREAARHAGLGLAIAKRIVELHGGIIAAESRPGRTVIRFELPGSCHASVTTADAGEAATTSRIGLRGPAVPDTP